MQDYSTPSNNFTVAVSNRKTKSIFKLKFQKYNYERHIPQEYAKDFYNHITEVLKTRESKAESSTIVHDKFSNYERQLRSANNIKEHLTAAILESTKFSINDIDITESALIVLADGVKFVLKNPENQLDFPILDIETTKVADKPASKDNYIPYLLYADLIKNKDEILEYYRLWLSATSQLKKFHTEFIVHDESGATVGKQVLNFLNTIPEKGEKIEFELTSIVNNSRKLVFERFSRHKYTAVVYVVINGTEFKELSTDFKKIYEDHVGAAEEVANIYRLMN